MKSINSNTKSIIPGDNSEFAPSGGVTKSKFDLKNFMMMFQDMDLENQQSILKALKPHLAAKKNGSG